MPRQDWKSNKLISYKEVISFKPAIIKPKLPAVIKPNLPAIIKPNMIDSVKQGLGFGLGNSLSHYILSNKEDIDCKKIIKEYEKCSDNNDCSIEQLDKFNKCSIKK